MTVSWTVSLVNSEANEDSNALSFPAGLFPTWLPRVAMYFLSRHFTEHFTDVSKANVSHFKTYQLGMFSNKKKKKKKKKIDWV